MASPLTDVTSETSEPGRAGGGTSAAVTVDQAVRGRLAELFVLEVCWRRFLALAPAGREAVLDTIARHREAGPGDVPWGTATAWAKLSKSLEKHRSALVVISSEDDTRQDLAQAFKGLIEVAHEQGPGFDILDPFGAWGADQAEPPVPRRVEIKAIMPPEQAPYGHRVVLTTNEFHRARQHPESYVLRLIVVPREVDDTEHVHWAGDILNPVGVLRLEEQIVRGIRSGNLPLILRW